MGPRLAVPRNFALRVRFRGDDSIRLTTRAAGFSLLEVLVAFVILALVGTALFRLFSGALGNATLADEYSRATLYAESRLAAVSVEAPLKESTLQGNSDDGRYAWTAVIAQYTPPGSTPDLDSAAPAMPVRLWNLAVTVTWPGAPGNERSVALSTVRIAIKE
jgi:general secretion pathway protein I